MIIWRLKVYKMVEKKILSLFSNPLSYFFILSAIGIELVIFTLYCDTIANINDFYTLRRSMEGILALSFRL